MLKIEVAQPGLFDEESRHGRLLEYSVSESVSNNSDSIERVKATLRNLLEYAAGIDGLYLNVSFGSGCWDLLNPAWRPEELVPFTALATEQLSMPSSQTDIFIWLHSVDAELIPQAVLHIYHVMSPVAVLELDVEGLKNKQARDLIGFVDSTANDEGDERLPVALIAEGKKGAGGSYVISQRWQHDLEKFNYMSVSEQEKVVGRTKEEDVELEGDDMPEDSHVSRTDAKVDGVGMKIYRRSYPYMASQLTATSHGRNKKPDNGLYFLAFACEMQRFTVQLDRMMGLSSDGISDKLMQFSQVKNSSYWFMPSAADLSLLLK